MAIEKRKRIGSDKSVGKNAKKTEDSTSLKSQEETTKRDGAARRRRKRSRGNLKDDEEVDISDLTTQQKHQLLAWHAKGQVKLRPFQIQLAERIKKEYLDGSR
mmetsp:Transcript_24921/g.34338  ORF Transcript_24921/g.34338 Transcript_24921/m.34338 type:complete len:103 (+) Transcript_24921:140-448(+)